MVNSDDVMEDEINKQVLIAMEEADVILFVVDVMHGLTDLDSSVAQMLRKSGKPVVVVSNKSDNFELSHQSAEFYSLGLGDPYSVSSVNGAGTGGSFWIIFSRCSRKIIAKKNWKIFQNLPWWDAPMQENHPSLMR